MSDSGGIGLYGKVASQPDFFRLGAGSFSQAGLDRWLQDAGEVLRAERAQWPATPAAFLLAPPGATAFVGALAASVDAAGRSFPLALFRELSADGARESLPSLPSAHAGFIREATALLSAGPSFEGEAVTRQAQGLTGSAPTPPSEPYAWKNEPASALGEALGGSGPVIAYALRTLVTACDRAAGNAPTAATALTIDAPVTGPATCAFWLEIARARLGWRDAMPSLLWTAGPQARLLITVGPPSPVALAFLANPSHRSGRFWPLRTAVTAALEQAWGSLTPPQRAAVEDPSATFGDLAAAFG
jgi:type VI secretion system ImpM family protein